ncbi:MAG: hypothetical protein M3O46_19870 [Myxococcota bacterium]|nr:hypothetical protein [Myxococcota bacterium]
MTLTQQQRATFLHAGATAGSFLLALVLDVSGHLSPQSHTLAVTLIGGLGLSTAVSAFRARAPVGGPALEQAIAELVATHLPGLIHHAQGELSNARAAFDRYLERQLGQASNAPTNPATPGSKAAERASARDAARTYYPPDPSEKIG